jgi:arginase family enzyme
MKKPTSKLNVIGIRYLGGRNAHGPGAQIGLVWFDAHGDFNTVKTTLEGN